MKKCLGMLFGGLLLSTVASASSIQMNCTAVASANGVGSFGLTALTCPQFNTLPAGDGIYDIIVYFQDGFVQGDPFTNNSFEFDYTNINAQLGVAGNAYVEKVTGKASPTGYTSTTDWGGSGGFYQIGSEITSGTGSWLGAGNVLIGDVTGLTNFGTLTGVGQLSVNVYIQYDYGTVPEPVTMVLVGGGLLGVGLLASKRRKKA